MQYLPPPQAGYTRPSIEDYRGIGELTAGDPSSQHLGLGGTIAVASMVMPVGRSGGGDAPTPGEGAGGPAVGGDVAPAGGEGTSGGAGDRGALAFTGFPAAAVGALGAATAAAGVGLRKAVRRRK